MFLKLKTDCTFTEQKTGITKTATAEDYPIAKIHNLQIASESNGFSGMFYLLFFWNFTHEFPFHTQQVSLPSEIIEEYRIVSIPNDVLEVDVAMLIQELVYNYLLTVFIDWELVHDITI
jgi:hypothetical protein